MRVRGRGRRRGKGRRVRDGRFGRSGGGWWVWDGIGGVVGEDGGRG